ncbi:hypothetical protein GCM10010201_00770 [Pilimelia columellifera subsp. columellifera]|uniref:Uncharacterized protein n=1 Tax=Pilimelia columellifera subsp. columellifera TaxID=706583 RepID=A0ABN3N0M1_9ACTN
MAPTPTLTRDQRNGPAGLGHPGAGGPRRRRSNRNRPKVRSPRPPTELVAHPVRVRPDVHGTQLDWYAPRACFGGPGRFVVSRSASRRASCASCEERPSDEQLRALAAARAARLSGRLEGVQKLSAGLGSSVGGRSSIPSRYAVF